MARPGIARAQWQGSTVRWWAHRLGLLFSPGLALGGVPFGTSRRTQAFAARYERRAVDEAELIARVRDLYAQLSAEDAIRGWEDGQHG